MKLRATSLYGVRVYTEGAVLNPRVDRLLLVSSVIVNVAQDVDEEWPLEVYDRFGNAVNVTMQPGDMILYESGSLVHGVRSVLCCSNVVVQRPFPLKGRYYANIFIHFEPVDSFEGREFVNEVDPDLPPYVLPDSPGAATWKVENPQGWSKVRLNVRLILRLLLQL
jgi:prolyl 4-hydroxylase